MIMGMILVFIIVTIALYLVTDNIEAFVGFVVFFIIASPIIVLLVIGWWKLWKLIGALL